jgi:hypothetical protein
MSIPNCPECSGIPLIAWSNISDILVCPCCSSRFSGNGERLHWGSHNDYATYLCYPAHGE